MDHWLPRGEKGHVILVGVDRTNFAVYAINCSFMKYTSGSEHADISGLLGNLAIEYLRTGVLPEVGSVVVRPGTTRKEGLGGRLPAPVRAPWSTPRFYPSGKICERPQAVC